MVAEMVTRVTQMGAVAIGFDVVFAEADRSSPALAADSFHGLDEETRAKLKALPSNDAVLAEAIGNSRVVLGQTALAQASAVPADDLPQTGFAVVGIRGLDVEPPLLEFPGLLRNIPELENAAAGRGLFTIRPEADGIVRRVPVVMLANGLKVPSLSVELLRVVSGAGAILIKMDEAGVQSVAFGRRGLEIATDRRGQLWFISARTTNPASFQRRMYCRARPIRCASRARSSSWGPPRSGSSTSRPRRSIRRCRVSKSTPSSCVVGNMGSDLHFNYSVLGDAVNLAARLESQTKSYGFAILIGARTAAAVGRLFTVLELDLLQVKGKTEPERIYTIVGRADERGAFAALAALNAEMLAHYHARDWQKCLETILRCRELGREAGLEEFYNHYVERVRRLIDAPPEPGWDGVWVAERK